MRIIHLGGPYEQYLKLKVFNLGGKRDFRINHRKLGALK